MLLHPDPATVNNVAFALILCLLVGAWVVFAIVQARGLKATARDAKGEMSAIWAAKGRARQLHAPANHMEVKADG